MDWINEFVKGIVEVAGKDNAIAIFAMIIILLFNISLIIFVFFWGRSANSQRGDFRELLRHTRELTTMIGVKLDNVATALNGTSQNIGAFANEVRTNHQVMMGLQSADTRTVLETVTDSLGEHDRNAINRYDTILTQSRKVFRVAQDLNRKFDSLPMPEIRGQITEILGGLAAINVRLNALEIATQVRPPSEIPLVQDSQTININTEETKTNDS